jgi:outer membrane protein assembly factor BamB
MYAKTFHTYVVLVGITSVFLICGCKKGEPKLSDEAPAPDSEVKIPTINQSTVPAFGGGGQRLDATITAVKRPRVNWPRFRDIDGNASSPFSQAPIRWNENRNVVWKADLPGRGSSSPIVLDNRVFITSYSGYGVKSITDGNKADLQHHLICLDRATGNELWRRTIKASSATSEMNNELFEHGYASSTPATDGKNVYAFFGTSGVYSFDLDGNLNWKANVGNATHHFGSSASLVVFGKLLIVNASIESSAVYGLNTETGGAVWKIENVIESWTTPAISRRDRNRYVLIINQKDIVRGFDLATGDELWRCDGINDYIVPAPVVHDGVVYCSGGKQRRILAIKLGGEGDVTATHKLWEKPLAANVCSPIYHDGHLYVINEGRMMECIRASDGELVKRVRVDSKKKVYASPTLVGEYLMVATKDQGVLVFKATPELEMVNANKIADDDSGFSASVVCSEHNLLLRNEQSVYCIGSSPLESEITEVSKPSEEIIEAPIHYDLDELGRTKRYVQFMTDDVEQIIKIILMPYKSVITPEQTEASRKFVLDRMDQYDDLKKRYREAYWNRQKDGSEMTDEEFAQVLIQLENEMNKLTGETRIDVKKLFSKEQMDQHIAEAKEFQRKEQEKLQKARETREAKNAETKK